MINHIQTLLLNESASVVQALLPEAEYGYIDPGYKAVVIPKNTSSIYAELFSGINNLKEKLRVVRQLLPLFASPELSVYAAFFDPRVIGNVAFPESVFNFYRTADSSNDIAVQATSSRDAPSAFTLSGNDLIDEKLALLYKIFSETTETVKKFAALLFAVVFQLEAVRMKSEA